MENRTKEEIALDLSQGDENIKDKLLNGEIKNIFIIKGYFEDQNRKRKHYFSMTMKKNPASIQNIIATSPSLSTTGHINIKEKWENFFSFQYAQYASKNTSNKESATVIKILQSITANKLTSLLHSSNSNRDLDQILNLFSDNLYNYTGQDVNLKCHIDNINELEYIYGNQQIQLAEQQQRETKDKDAKDNKEPEDIKPTGPNLSSLNYWKERYPNMDFLKATSVISIKGQPPNYHEKGDKLYIKLDISSPKEKELAKKLNVYNEKTDQAYKVASTILEITKDNVETYHVVAQVTENKVAKILIEDKHALLAAPTPPKKKMLEDEIKSNKKKLFNFIMVGSIVLAFLIVTLIALFL